MRRVSAACAVGLLLVGCSFNDELAADLEAQVHAFNAPDGWTWQESADGPYADEGYDLLFGGPFCSSDACLHAVGDWTLGDAPDAAAVTDAIENTPGWTLAHEPDCDFGDVEAQNVEGCVWEADIAGLYVLVKVNHAHIPGPWHARVAAYPDDYIHRHTNSPAASQRRREVAADLIDRSDRVVTPATWRLITDEVLPDPADCDDIGCMTVTRVWWGMPSVTVGQITRMLADAGWETADPSGTCQPDPNATRPHEVCTVQGHDTGAVASVTATSVGDVYEVTLTVKRDG